MNRDEAILHYAEKTIHGEIDNKDLDAIARLGISAEVADAALDIEEYVSSFTNDNIRDDEMMWVW